MSRDWESIAAKKREALLASIPSEWKIPDNIKPPEDQTDVTTFPTESGWFTKQELEITGSSATQLLGKLTSGIWSSLEVTKAFCKRASAAHQLVCSAFLLLVYII
jgi:amidase